MQKHVLLVVAFVLSFSLSAQTQVQDYLPGITQEGVTYFLPKTHLRFVLRAEKTLYTPGEFAAYAEQFLNLKKVETTAQERWSLTQIDAQAYGQADSAQAYSIAFRPKSVAPEVELGADGRLLAINAKGKDNESLIRPSVQLHPTKQHNGERYKTQEILRAGSTWTKAELTAQEIYDIRENRNLLIKGQAEFNPKDGEQLKLMLAQLDEQEQALLSLFVGSTRTETHVFTLDFVPQDEVRDWELCRFSRFLGLLDAGDLAGDPIYISVEDLKTLPPLNDNPKAKKKKEEGLRYCNPSNARIQLRTPERNLLTLTVPLAQFGRIEQLGGVLFNKKYSTRLLLSPTTGGIQQLDIEGER